MTEETCAADSAIGVGHFLLVDPLDGTKEFVRGSDEFTVNIALIEQGKPVAGAVYAPALRRLCIGGITAHRLVVTGDYFDPKFEDMQPIRSGNLRPQDGGSWSAVRIWIRPQGNGSTAIVFQS